MEHLGGQSQASRLRDEIDTRADAFLDRPIEGDWSYLWIDATYVTMCQEGCIVSVVVIIAVRVRDGRREVQSMDMGASVAEPFWTTFLRNLSRRGLRGVKLVFSGNHGVIKAAVSKVPKLYLAALPGNTLAYASKRVVVAFIAAVFAQGTSRQFREAREQWRNIAGQLRLTAPKLAALMDSPEEDVLAYMTFPAALCTKLHSANSIERLNHEVKTSRQRRCHLPQRSRHPSPYRCGVA